MTQGEAIDSRTHGPASAGCDPAAVSTLAHDLLTVLRYHQLMGIESYPLSSSLRQLLQPATPSSADTHAPVRGDAASAPVKAAPLPPESPPREEKGEAEVRLRLLQETVRACHRCLASQNCLRIVPGSGRVGAPLLVVGDYCLQDGQCSSAILFGAEEDTMLWNMMRAIGLTPAEVYVTNAVKCCPQSTVPPSEESLRSCREHLLREIEVVQPKVLCAMGDIAAHALVGSNASSFRLRGRFHPYRENRSLQVMVTLHPRLLLKNATMKKAVWQDLQSIQRLLQTN